MSYTHQDFNYIDTHVHFFPSTLFKAIWKFFERPDNDGNVRGWPINYKLPNDELVRVLESKNVDAFTTLNYAHKQGIAEDLNEWTVEFNKNYDKTIPFGTVWPTDEDKEKYVRYLFDEHDFIGIKTQPLVQKFSVNDARMDCIYELIVDRGKWYYVHAGTAPYRNDYVGFKYFKPFIEKNPNIKVIVAHFGAFEYQKFFKLLDKYENLYLDTAMVFIPSNIFPERKVKQPSREELLSYQDRILFGSDFPNIPYEYENATKGLLGLDLPRSFYENIFYKNAKRLFF